MIRVVGIDPGLVDTGVVRFNFDTENKRYAIDSRAFTAPSWKEGPDFEDMKFWVDMYKPDRIFMENYRPRSGYNTDIPMLNLLKDIEGLFPDVEKVWNMGARHVITRPMLVLMGAWNFDIITNHQDIRAAAQIALLGMVKDDELNAVLYEYITDALEGNRWGELQGGE